MTEVVGEADMIHVDNNQVGQLADGGPVDEGLAGRGVAPTWIDAATENDVSALAQSPWVAVPLLPFLVHSSYPQLPYEHLQMTKETMHSCKIIFHCIK